MQKQIPAQGSYRVLEDAIVYPCPKRTAGCGVLEASGKFVETSAVLRGDQPLHDAPDFKKPEAYLAGTHLFGGILMRHFGHFITESTARLWPLAQKDFKVDSVLFIPKNLPRGVAPKMTFFNKDWLPFFTLGHAFEELIVPTRVERLIVPTQGFGTAGHEAGFPDFHSYTKAINWPDAPVQQRYRNLYVTRASLNFSKKGGFLASGEIKQLIQAYGFHSFHPEQHSIAEQIAAYQTAQNLIFDDGSALHVFGLVAKPHQHVASIARRLSADEPSVGLRQLKAFADIDLHVIDAVKRDWYPQEGQHPTSKSHGELSIEHLVSGLNDFVKSEPKDDISKIDFPSEAQLAAQMKERGYIAKERPKALEKLFA